MHYIRKSACPKLFDFLLLKRLGLLCTFTSPCKAAHFTATIIGIECICPPPTMSVGGASVDRAVDFSQSMLFVQRTPHRCRSNDSLESYKGHLRAESRRERCAQKCIANTERHRPLKNVKPSTSLTVCASPGHFSFTTQLETISSKVSMSRKISKTKWLTNLFSV